MSAEDSKSCPGCGETIPAEAPDGLCPKCLLTGIVEHPAPPPSEISLEEVQDSFPKFEILELIGIGGIGRVYRVRDPQVDREVALKILSPDRVEDPEWIERFTREAKALARLNHPHIVQVHSFGTDPQPHLVMEFVDGVNLRQTMEAGGLSAREALVIVPKLCDALHYAHEHGVLHRDIKPENILVDTEGRVKLVDFGLAKLHDEDSLPFTLTQSGAKLGTIAYMAPEQVEKPSEVDHRADIYSLGVVFYEMLTGELPLGRFPTPSEANGTDERLDGVVMRTLEKKKEKRYPDAGTMGTEVTQVSRLESVPKAPEPSQPKNRGKLVLGIAAALLLLFVVIPSLMIVSYLAIQKDKAQEIAEAERAKMEEVQKEALKAREIELAKRSQKRQQEWDDKTKRIERARRWTEAVSSTTNVEGKQEALREILEAIRSEDPDEILQGLSVFPYLGEVEFDREPFQDPIRRQLKNEDWEIRGTAITSLFTTDYTESDLQSVIGTVDSVPANYLERVAWPLAKDNEKDFTAKHGKEMLKLLEKGLAADIPNALSKTKFDSRGILGVLWGAKVTPEIESLVIEWSKLDATESGMINTGSRGYNAFYHALSVLRNKSSASVERLLFLAESPDTVNIGGRCLWGFKGTVPDKADQQTVASAVIKLLGQRNGQYQWKEGLDLLDGFATPVHLPALEELAARETLPKERKQKLEALISKLSQQANQPSQKPLDLAFRLFDEIAPTDDPEAKKKAIQQMLDAMQSDDPEVVLHAVSAYARLRGIAMDRSPFRDPLRNIIGKETLPWKTREIALNNYFIEEHDPFEEDPLLEFVDAIPIQNVGSFAKALSRHSERDFFARHGATMLRLLQRGYEAARDRKPGAGQSLITALDGARVTPEIEKLLIDWTRLDATDGQPMKSNSRGAFAFRVGLCGISNKSRAAVERLLELAANPDVSIGSRSIHGMRGTIPKIADQKLAASGTLEVLQQRDYEYMWEQALVLLHNYAAEEHLSELREILKRRDLSQDHRLRVRAIIEKIEP